MVGVLAFKSEAIKNKSLLKSIKGITQKMCKQHDISLNDIGLIIHTGTYRQNFRAEPAFAAHLQQALKIGCDDVSSTSKHVFSFDVLDVCIHYILMQHESDWFFHLGRCSWIIMIDQKIQTLCEPKFWCE